MDPNRRFGARRAERRKSKRDAMGIPVSLHAVSQSRVVLLLDVSTTGARIAGELLPAVGRDILLKIGGVELFGTVVRSAGKETAMNFDRPIGAKELDILRSFITDEPTEATVEER